MLNLLVMSMLSPQQTLRYMLLATPKPQPKPIDGV